MRRMRRIRGCWDSVRGVEHGSGVDMVLQGLSSVGKRSTRLDDVVAVVAVANADAIGIGWVACLSYFRRNL